MVLLKNLRMASVIVTLLFVLSLTGCAGGLAARVTLTEANPLSSGIYHIEITGTNGLALLAYKTEVVVLNSCAQWDGLATVGAYNMVFQQECHSLYSEEISAKLWREKWVQSTTTSPSLQVQQWLQECRHKGRYNSEAIPATSVLPLPDDDPRMVVSLHLKKTTIDWNALCDAHLDSLFGTQAFLTDACSGSATLYFDAQTFALIGVVFTAQNGQTEISGNIVLSTADGHTLQKFPTPETITEGTLYEEWNILTTEENAPQP